MVKKSALSFTERTDIDGNLSLNAHLIQRGSISDWRDYQPALVFEAYETFIEEVVD